MYLFSWIAVIELGGIGLSMFGVGFAYGVVQKSLSSLLFRTTGD